MMFYYFSRQFSHIFLCLVACLVLNACSSGSGDNDTNLRPDPVDSITLNRGDLAISVGWEYFGASGVAFVVSANPTTPVASLTPVTVSLNGQTALITGLSENTAYDISVQTRAKGLQSPPLTSRLTPTVIDDAQYTALLVNNDPSLSGVFDPSFLRDSAGTIWMAYSGVDYYQMNGNLVQDVSTRVARSDDNGTTFTLVTTLGSPGSTTVTDTSMTLGCANNQCTGRWVYEVPFLIDDVNDPNSNQRFKIYAHKYFLMPGASPATIYLLGALVRWTAPTPDSLWSGEDVVFSWNLTPPELAGGINLNQSATTLSNCLLFTEGTASVGMLMSQDSIDFVFSCPYPDAGASTIRQRIVQFRSTDHGQSLTYIGEPLSADDAGQSGAEYYSAPSLLPRVDSAPVLLVTPVVNGLYAGCEVFTYSDITNAAVFKSNGNPDPLLLIPQLASNFGGACAWDRGMSGTGITLNSFDALSTPPFSIQSSHHPL